MNSCSKNLFVLHCLIHVLGVTQRNKSKIKHGQTVHRTKSNDEKGKSETNKEIIRRTDRKIERESAI